jgi:hypothetical protein
MNGNTHAKASGGRGRLRAVLGALLAGSCLTLAAHADASLYWTTWVSEENNGPWSACFAANEAASGFGCSGKYCDNVRLQCETLNGGMTLNPSSATTNWFSEERSDFCNNITGCGDSGSCQFGQIGTIDSLIPGVVNGVHCSGKNCDNVQFLCGMPVKYDSAGKQHQAFTDYCFSSGPISEEQGSIDFGPNYYATSASCTGKYCDNLTFWVCHFRQPF